MTDSVSKNLKIEDGIAVALKQGCQFSRYFQNSEYFSKNSHIPDFVSLLFILIEKFAKTYLDFLINCKQHKTNAYVCC